MKFSSCAISSILVRFVTTDVAATAAAAAAAAAAMMPKSRYQLKRLITAIRYPKHWGNTTATAGTRTERHKCAISSILSIPSVTQAAAATAAAAAAAAAARMMIRNHQ